MSYGLAARLYTLVYVLVQVLCSWWFLSVACLKLKYLL